MASSLVALSNLIASSVSALEKACMENNLSFPSLDDPFHPASEAFRTNQVAAEAANIIAAAAHQLASMVMSPSATLANAMSGTLKSAALRVCLEANVVEILREGGPQGVHAKDIALRANISAEKTARLLRYLATHNIFKEVRPDVFVNNRISSLLDTGKAVDDILANPDSKHDDTPGIAALGGHHMDEVAKSATYLWENMSDPLSAHSTEMEKAPLNRAFGWDGPFWAWLGQEEQAYRQRRFGFGMKGVALLDPMELILKAFDWKSLPKDSVVVDVGGGVGGCSMSIAKENSHIKVIVQDLLPVIEEGKKAWNVEMPEALNTGRVTLQAHDFFTPQLVKNASVFILRLILHDWSDRYATKILKELRKVALADTKLIILENLIPFACRGALDDRFKNMPGAIAKEPPEPLLANYGIAKEQGYIGDLTMMILFNTQERTINHMAELLENAGWRLEKVVRDPTSNLLQPMQAVPILETGSAGR